jgi:kynureninase
MFDRQAFEPMDMATARRMAEQLDASDALAPMRERFLIPMGPEGQPVRYFCGNSLGLQPKTAQAAVDEEMQRWAELAVSGHFTGNTPWTQAHASIREPIAKLVGAKPSEVVVMNTLTVNLHLMMASFFRPQGKRCKILMESHAFPSDRYAVVSQLQHHGLSEDDLIEVGRADYGEWLDEDHLIGLFEKHADELALILLPGVQYYTGQNLDIVKLGQAAHKLGITVGFDLAHSVGNVRVRLDESQADFAVWCHYKYCNAGPGAIAGAFIHERHHGQAQQRLAGWYGHRMQDRFAMKPDFIPEGNADGWIMSNPPILSMVPLRASMALIEEAGQGPLLDKSLRLTGFFEHMLSRFLHGRVRSITPSIPARRGCQLSLEIVAEGIEPRQVFDQLIASGFVLDWREPNVLRAAPVPLYNRFRDVIDLIEALDTLTRREQDKAHAQSC